MICLNGNNPYLNNRDAVEILPRTQVTHEGKVYTKQSYRVSHIVEKKITALRRLMKIVKGVALTILTGLIALAFRSVRKLLADGFRGREYLPEQRRAEVLIPHQDLFENADTAMVIASMLPIKDLLAMRASTSQNRKIAEKTLINQLNAGTITPWKLGIKNIERFTEYFGDKCQEITRLELRPFLDTRDNYLERIIELFPRLNQLLLGQLSYVDTPYRTLLANLQLAGRTQISEVSFFEHCNNIKSLKFEATISEGPRKYTQIEDLSFLEHCLNLESLYLSGCTKINDFTPLKQCLELKELRLGECKEINDLRFLEPCKKLEYLSLSGWTGIEDFSFLQNFPNLKILDLQGCTQIKDISFLQNCPNLEALNLSRCHQIEDFSALQNCPNLQTLNIEGCINVKINILQYCHYLSSLNVAGTPINHISLADGCLNLSGCAGINDFSFLHLANVKALKFDWCTDINDFSFLKNFQNIKALSIAGCTQIEDFSFLSHLPNLKELDISYCTQIEGLSILDYCPNLDLKDLKFYGCKNLQPLIEERLLNRMQDLIDQLESYRNRMQ